MSTDNGLLMPLYNLVVTLCDGARADDPEMDGAMIITALSLDIPIELRAVSGEGQLQIWASPPTQRVKTTFLPIFHRMSVRITLNEETDTQSTSHG
jgi:hypothetical protein